MRIIMQCFLTIGSAAFLRAPAPRMQMLRVRSADEVDALLAAPGDGIVVLHFSTSSAVLGNALVERVASNFAASKLYGGVSAAVVTILTDTPAGCEIAALRGVTEFPRTQVHQKGQFRTLSRRDNLDAALGAALLALGARSPDNKRNRARGSSALGTGLPSATAVDDVDFTGGAGGSPMLGSGPDRGTTRDYFPTTQDEFERERGERDDPQW